MHTCLCIKFNLREEMIKHRRDMNNVSPIYKTQCSTVYKQTYFKRLITPDLLSTQA